MSSPSLLPPPPPPIFPLERPPPLPRPDDTMVNMSVLMSELERQRLDEVARDDRPALDVDEQEQIAELLSESYNDEESRINSENGDILSEFGPAPAELRPKSHVEQARPPSYPVTEFTASSPVQKLGDKEMLKSRTVLNSWQSLQTRANTIDAFSSRSIGPKTAVNSTALLSREISKLKEEKFSVRHIRKEMPKVMEKARKHAANTATSNLRHEADLENIPLPNRTQITNSKLPVRTLGADGPAIPRAKIAVKASYKQSLATSKPPLQDFWSPEWNFPPSQLESGVQTIKRRVESKSMHEVIVADLSLNFSDADRLTFYDRPLKRSDFA